MLENTRDQSEYLRGLLLRVQNDEEYFASLVAQADEPHPTQRDPIVARGAVARAEKARAKAEKDNAILRRKMRESNAALKAAQQAYLDDRAKLTALRGSRTMKVGKAVLLPARVARTEARRVTDMIRSLPVSSGDRDTGGDLYPHVDEAGVGVQRPATPKEASSSHQSAGKQSSTSRTVAKADLLGHVQTLNEFRALPLAEQLRSAESGLDAERLFTLLNKLWYKEGDISRGARLIRKHKKVIEEGSPGLQATVSQILSAESLQAGNLSVPPRSSGAAYRVAEDRILYAVNNAPTFSSNGYATRTRGIVSALKDRGLDVTVVSRPGFPWNSGYQGKERRFVTELDDVPYVAYPHRVLKNATLRSSLDSATDAFIREARRVRPALIHSASDHLTALPALIAARTVGVPFIYEVRGLWEVSRASNMPGWEQSERYSLSVDLESLVLREADQILAITHQVADELVRRGAPKSKVHLLPNAIDTEAFMPIPADRAYAEEHGIDAHATVLGFAGSMVPYEGLGDLLTAFANLVSEDCPVQLVLAGSGSEEDSLREASKELGVQDKVKFLGRIPQADVPRLLSNLDIMICPRRSTPVTELVSPLKPLEGFASYCTTVLSDVAPHRDLAGSGNVVRAALFEAGNPNDLTEVLRKLIGDTDSQLQMRRAARLWVLQKRKWSAVAQAALDAYSAALSATNAQGVPLSSLKVGIIADEFTTAAFSGSVNLLPLSRADWVDQLDGLDFVLIESAWHGNKDQWHRGVGWYSDEEFEELSYLLRTCRKLGVPTVFWNKEDPVHTDRFRIAASLCDHVFTTDADLIDDYRGWMENPAATVNSMPFFAQPRIHNPLGETERDPSIAYAGTFYGSKYPERTKALLPFLSGASEIGLKIYDRQADDPDSPYRFPAEFEKSVVGSLPYDQVLDTYRAHVAHINGNSAPASPTMFSRRVAEVASSGGVVISTPSRALEELFGHTFPMPMTQREIDGLLALWMFSPDARREEAWRQMRTILRSYTADDVLAILARTSGIAADVPGRAEYSLVVPSLDEAIVHSIVDQTVRPKEVIVLDGDLANQSKLLEIGCIASSSVDLFTTSVPWIAFLAEPVGPTWAEDSLLATQFGDFHRVVVTKEERDSLARELTSETDIALERSGFIDSRLVDDVRLIDQLVGTPATASVEAALPASSFLPVPRPESSVHVTTTAGARTRLLVAGHDLKFIRPAFDELRQLGFEIAVDQWSGHSGHDEERSRELLANADVVLAEWCLGNTVWYSKNVASDQRLVTRVHLQEIDLPYLRRTNEGRVDAYSFVNPLVGRAAVVSHGIPENKVFYVPNFVTTEELDLPKVMGARNRVGFVGMVPQRKRLDLALDVLELALQHDPDISLVVKGRRPEEFEWMAKRPDEMAYYNLQYERVEAINRVHPGAVVFEGHSGDMAEWYRTVGSVLSVSDFESFHYTIADGAASGAFPGVLYWPGAEYSYPLEWLKPSVEEVGTSLLAGLSQSPEAIQRDVSQYSKSRVIGQLAMLLRGAEKLNESFS